MARGVNKAILIGHLGHDPEVRYTPSGSCVVNISLATTKQWKDKNTGDKHEKTEWHKVVFFGKLAEIAGEYLKKGSLVYIEGEINTEQWEDNEGNRRYTTKIYANQMQMLGSKGEHNSSEQTSSAREYAEASGNTVEDFNDDIPF